MVKMSLVVPRRVVKVNEVRVFGTGLGSLFSSGVSSANPNAVRGYAFPVRLTPNLSSLRKEDSPNQTRPDQTIECLVISPKGISPKQTKQWQGKSSLS